MNITDTFAQDTLDKNLKPTKYVYKSLTDTFAEQNKIKSTYKAKVVDYNEIIPKVTNKPVLKKVVVIDQTSMTAVPVKIKKYFTTKKKVQEGDYIEFGTTKDIVLNKKTYPAGTTVKARIETVSLNKSMGVPSDLVVGNFSLDGIPLGGEISKVGANRSLWVYPCVYGTSWFFGVGLLFIPIRGGHAKIKTSETYTLYAE